MLNSCEKKLVVKTCFADIDECTGANDCQQDCTNTPGSFECTCTEEFTLDDNNKTCTRKFLRLYNYFL